MSGNMSLCFQCQAMRWPQAEQIYHKFEAFGDLLASSRHCRLCRIFVQGFELEKHVEPLLGYERSGRKAYTSVSARYIEAEHVSQLPEDSDPFLSAFRQVGGPNPVPGFLEVVCGSLCVGEIGGLGHREARPLIFCTDNVQSQVDKKPIWYATRPVTFETSLPIIQHWLGDCTLNHPECSESGIPPLPRRVIDVGPPDGSKDPHLLITNNDHCRYATLSHCWGAGVPLVTKKNTLDDRKLGIPLGSLPRTFQDAVWITRKLGLQYLWIDALCIIQDDSTDWEHEAADMVNIYKNTFINIAATAATNAEDGCFRTYEPAMRIEFLWEDVPSICALSDRISITLVRYKPSERGSLLHSPLNKRAWVLQELTLARRTLHFAEDQLFWQCANRVTSQDGILNTPANSSRTGPNGPRLGPVLYHGGEDIYNAWWDMVEDYSNRSLTKKTDKFAALAGITMFFRDKAKDTPVAGLWKRMLMTDLLWRNNTQSVQRPPRLEDIPTWSWVSIDGPVKGPLLRGRGTRYSRSFSRTLADVPELPWTGQPLISGLKGCKLMLQGYMKQILAAYSPRWPDEIDSNHCKVFTYPPNSAEMLGPNIGIGSCTFDDAPPPPAEPVWCIELGASENSLWGLQNKFSSWQYDVLLLEPTKRRDEFRRIGQGHIREPHGIDEVPTPGPPDNFKGSWQAITII
ncbi:MAG: hypothetical protein M1840_003848 [Geoglossum simile]|nr:MAG: hypothetical protein M1840_003848 [Geoglossum simile]